MSENHDQDQQLETFLQTHSRTVELSASAKSEMLAAIAHELHAEAEKSEDYTWPQFFIRFASLAASLFFTLYLVETMSDMGAYQNDLIQPPAQHRDLALEALLDKQSSPSIAAVKNNHSTRQLSGLTWMDIKIKGQSHED